MAFANSSSITDYAPIRNDLEQVARQLKDYLQYHVSEFYSWLQVEQVEPKIDLEYDYVRMCVAMNVRIDNWHWRKLYDETVFNDIYRTPNMVEYLTREVTYGLSTTMFNKFMEKQLASDHEAHEVFKKRVGPQIDYVMFGDGNCRPAKQVQDNTVQVAFKDHLYPYVGLLTEIAKCPRTELAKMLMLTP